MPPLPSKFAISLARFTAAGVNAASTATTVTVATVGGVVAGASTAAAAGPSPLGTTAGTASAGASSGASAGSGSGGASGAWAGSYQHLLAQSPTVQNLPSNAFVESDDTEDHFRLRSQRLIKGQTPPRLLGQRQGNLQHAPETRLLLNPSNDQVQERLTKLFTNLYTAGPRLMEPQTPTSGPQTRSRSTSRPFPTSRRVPRSAAVDQLLYAVAREPASSVRSRATRPRAHSFGSQVRTYASVATDQNQLGPNETPYTHERDLRAEATLRQLDMDETQALVQRISATLDSTLKIPPWERGQSKEIQAEETKEIAHQILPKISALLKPLMSQNTFDRSRQIQEGLEVLQQASTIPASQRSDLVNNRVLVLCFAMFNAQSKQRKLQARLTPDVALKWIRDAVRYQAFDKVMLTYLIEYLATHPYDTIPGSLSKLLALDNEAQLIEENSATLKQTVSNFDFALALLHAVNGDPDLQLTAPRPYFTLLEVTAAKADAKAGLEIFTLLQENDSLAGDSLTPRGIYLVLKSLVGPALLNPDILNPDLNQTLAQHKPYVVKEGEEWKADAMAVIQSVFDNAALYWKLWSAPKAMQDRDDWDLRPFTDQSQGWFFDDGHTNPVLTAYNAMLHSWFLVGQPQQAMEMFKHSVNELGKVITVSNQIPPPTRDMVSIMLVGLASTQGVPTAVKWYEAVLSAAPEGVPSPSFDGLASLCRTYLQSAAAEGEEQQMWKDALASGQFTRLLKHMTENFNSDRYIPFDLSEQLTDTKIVSQLDGTQVELITKLIGLSIANESLVPKGKDIEVKRTDAFGSNLLFLADKSMGDGFVANAASLLTYVLKWTTMWTQERLGGSPNEYRLKSATERKKTAAVAKRMIRLIQLSRKVPEEQRSEVAAALLGTALKTFAPMLSTYPKLLMTKADKKVEQPQAHLWASQLTKLYLTATKEDRVRVLSKFSEDEWSTLLQAFAYEEQHAEPNWERVTTEGLGLVADDYEQCIPALTKLSSMVQRRSMRNDRGQLVEGEPYLARPDVSQPATALLARYPTQDAIRVLEKINPSYFRMMHAKPWDPSVTEETEVVPDPSTALPSLSSRALKALGPIQPADATPDDPNLRFAPVDSITDALGIKAHEMLNAPTKPKNDTRMTQTWNLLLNEAKIGRYPSPPYIAALVNVAGVRSDMEMVRKLYLLGSHVVRSIKGLAEQGTAWASLENAMICATAHCGQCRLANSHRHLLVNAGQVPSADAYGSLIAASKVTTDEVYVSKELFDEALRLGVKPNLYLFNTIISTLSRARRADAALAYYTMMLEHGIKPSSITYGALINAYVRRGEINAAKGFFKKMENARDFRASAAPYNTMIGYYVAAKDRKNALVYFDKMKELKVKFASYTWKLLLDTYGLIEPVQEDKLIETFNELVRDARLEGVHLATLITSYGVVRNDLEKAQALYDSVSKGMGRNLPDAVCHQALMEVFVHHNRVDLLYDLIQRFTKDHVRMTAYQANVAIKAFGASGEHGLTEARRVFASMCDPPMGVAAIGNHSSRSDAKGHKKDELKLPSYYSELAPGGTATAATAAVKGSRGTPSSPWARTFREPSTYISMIHAELAAGHLEPAQWLVERMQLRAFPIPILNQVRTLLREYEQYGPEVVKNAGNKIRAPTSAPPGQKGVAGVFEL